MTIRISRNNTYIVILFFLLLTACDTNTVYHTYKHISKEGWNKNDTLFFNVPFEFPADTYELLIGIRNNSHYSYSNLFLSVNHNISDSTLFVCDTLEYHLVDQNGKWKGKGWGTLYQTSFPYKDMYIENQTNYQIKVSHSMSNEQLEGITDIGIQMKRRR